MLLGNTTSQVSHSATHDPNVGELPHPHAIVLIAVIGLTARRTS